MALDWTAYNTFKASAKSAEAALAQTVKTNAHANTTPHSNSVPHSNTTPHTNTSTPYAYTYHSNSSSHSNGSPHSNGYSYVSHSNNPAASHNNTNPHINYSTNGHSNYKSNPSPSSHYNFNSYTKSYVYWSNAPSHANWGNSGHSNGRPDHGNTNNHGNSGGYSNHANGYSHSNSSPHSNSTPHTNGSTHGNSAHANSTYHVNSTPHSNSGMTHTNYVPSKVHNFMPTASQTLVGTVSMAVYTYDKNVDGVGSVDAGSITSLFDINIVRTHDLAGNAVAAAGNTLNINNVAENAGAGGYTWDWNTANPFGTGQADGTYRITVTAKNTSKVTVDGITVTYVGVATSTTFKVQQNVEPSIVVQQDVVARGTVFALGTVGARINTSGTYQEFFTRTSGANKVLPVTILVTDPDASDKLQGTCVVKNAGGTVLGTYTIVWASAKPTSQAILDGAVTVGDAAVKKYGIVPIPSSLTNQGILYLTFNVQDYDTSNIAKGVTTTSAYLDSNNAATGAMFVVLDKTASTALTATTLSTSTSYVKQEKITVAGAQDATSILFQTRATAKRTGDVSETNLALGTNYSVASGGNHVGLNTSSDLAMAQSYPSATYPIALNILGTGILANYEGAVEIRTYFKDLAQNEAPLLKTVYMDNKVPVPSVSKSAGRYGQEATIVVNATDGGSGINTAAFYAKISTNSADTVSAADLVAPGSTLSFAGKSGSQYVIVQAQDKLGNVFKQAFGPFVITTDPIPAMSTETWNEVQRSVFSRLGDLTMSKAGSPPGVVTYTVGTYKNWAADPYLSAWEDVRTANKGIYMKYVITDNSDAAYLTATMKVKDKSSGTVIATLNGTMTADEASGTVGAASIATSSPTGINKNYFANFYMDESLLAGVNADISFEITVNQFNDSGLTTLLNTITLNNTSTTSGVLAEAQIDTQVDNLVVNGNTATSWAETASVKVSATDTKAKVNVFTPNFGVATVGTSTNVVGDTTEKTYTLSLPDGQASIINWTVGVTDKAMNTRQVSGTSYIDNANPVVTVTAPSANWYNDSATVNLNFTDTGVGTFAFTRYKWTQTTDVPGTWDSGNSLSFNVTNPGYNYLHVWVRDSVGNEVLTKYGPYKINATATINSLGINGTAGVAQELAVSGKKLYIINGDSFSNNFKVGITDVDKTDYIDVRFKATHTVSGAVIYDKMFEDNDVPDAGSLDVERKVWYLDETTFDNWPDGVYRIDVTLKEDKFDGAEDVQSTAGFFYVALKKTSPPQPTMVVTPGVASNQVTITFPNEAFGDPGLNTALQAKYLKEYRIGSGPYQTYTGTISVSSATVVTARYTDFAGNVAYLSKSIDAPDSGVVLGVPELAPAVAGTGTDVVVDEDRGSVTYFIGLRKSDTGEVTPDIFKFIP